MRLKVNDIDSDRMQILIRQSKGKKDRFTLLAEKTLKILRLYYDEYKPKVYWDIAAVKQLKSTHTSQQKVWKK